MKHYCFSSFLVLLTINVFSQSDFRPGLYITNNNDTIRGLLDYRGDILNARVCSFKKDASSTTIEFLPGTIKAYRFTDNKYYVSKEMPNDSAKRIVFMEYLINGKTSVYYRRTYENERFYIEKDGKLAEMNNDETIYKDKFEDHYYKNTNQYKGILKYYFQDAPTIIKTIDNVGFNRSSLIRISKKYHEKVCNGEQCIVYEKKMPKIIFHYGFYMGGAIQHINMFSHSYYTFQATSKPSFFGGMLIQSSLPSANERIFAQLSAGYGNTSYHAKDALEEYQMKYSYLITSFEILYKLPLKKIKPNFSVGLFYKTLLSNDYSYCYYNDAYKPIHKIDPNEISKKFLGINAGAGIDIPILPHLICNISLKYEYGWNYLNATSMASKCHNYSLSTGILF